MILVLLPHYNNLPGLYKSILSIHHKETIHVLVVDDGSASENIPDIDYLNSIANPNVLIRLEKIRSNQGITNALNKGLSIALQTEKYTYFARLDCDDVCVKNRFRIQQDYLEKNTDISLIGSWVKFVNEDATEAFSVKPPLHHDEIKRKMAVRCNFIHPAVMMKRKVVEEMGFYPDNFEAAEDYAYFYEISKRYKTANINKFLTKVSLDPKGISFTKRKLQNRNKIRVIKEYSPKNLQYVYGLIFNYGLLLAPHKMVNRVKKVVLK